MNAAQAIDRDCFQLAAVRYLERTAQLSIHRSEKRLTMNENVFQFFSMINNDTGNLHKRILSDNQFFKVRKSVDVDEFFTVITRIRRNVNDLLPVTKLQFVKFQSRTDFNGRVSYRNV